MWLYFLSSVEHKKNIKKNDPVFFVHESQWDSMSGVLNVLLHIEIFILFFIPQ